MFIGDYNYNRMLKVQISIKIFTHIIDLRFRRNQTSIFDSLSILNNHLFCLKLRNVR